MDFLKDQIDASRAEWENQLPCHVNAGTQMLTSPGHSPQPVRVTNGMVIKQLQSNLEQTQVRHLIPYS